MAGTELLRREGTIATRILDEYVILPDRTIRRPIDDSDWHFWKVWGRIFGWSRVALDEFEGCRVSTVFLGMDHDFGLRWKWTVDEDGWPVAEHPVGYQPLIFETMVFGGPEGGVQDRYRTWEEAELGHRAIVARVKRALARGRTRPRKKKT